LDSGVGYGVGGGFYMEIIVMYWTPGIVRYEDGLLKGDFVDRWYMYMLWCRAFQLTTNILPKGRG